MFTDPLLLVTLTVRVVLVVAVVVVLVLLLVLLVALHIILPLGTLFLFIGLVVFVSVRGICMVLLVGFLQPRTTSSSVSQITSYGHSCQPTHRSKYKMHRKRATLRGVTVTVTVYETMQTSHMFTDPLLVVTLTVRVVLVVAVVVVLVLLLVLLVARILRLPLRLVLLLFLLAPGFILLVLAPVVSLPLLVPLFLLMLSLPVFILLLPSVLGLCRLLLPSLVLVLLPVSLHEYHVDVNTLVYLMYGLCICVFFLVSTHALCYVYFCLRRYAHTSGVCLYAFITSFRMCIRASE